MFVDEVLEFVHDAAVRDEGERVGKVLIAVAAFPIAEEAAHIRPAQKFHAHGMAFRRLHAAHVDVVVDAAHVDAVRGIGVPELMRQNVCVRRRAVEISENEGLVVVADEGAVAPARLVVAALDVERARLRHAVEEVADLTVHLVVHPARFPEGFRDGERERRVSLFGVDVVIREAERSKPHLPLDALFERAHDGHERLFYVGAEGFHHLPRIARPAHAVVAELHIILIAHLFRHPVADVGSSSFPRSTVSGIFSPCQSKSMPAMS